LSDEHLEYASASIRSSLEFDSNVNVESEVQTSKYGVTKVATEEGLQIDWSDEHSRNDSLSIRSSLEFDLNANVESEPHQEKQDLQSRSI
jgi:hypothetical protein